MTIRWILISGFFLAINACSLKTENKISSSNYNADVVRIACYNTENLFDTIDDPTTNDQEFLPQGKLRWNSERYHNKIRHIGDVIEALNVNKNLAIMGFAEIENALVLKDILQNVPEFNMIHNNSSDPRGIDVCLIYNEQLFTPITSYLCRFKKDEAPDLFLREVLLVKGLLFKDTVHILLNHWPSRRGGEDKTANKRIAAAMLTQEVIDSVFQKQPQCNLIVMGDFNDEPHDESMSIMLKLKSDKKGGASDLINPFSKLKEAGEGTCSYKHKWYLFDQILISNSMLNKKGIEYADAAIFKPDWLYYKTDLRSGPFRTFMGNRYYGGYSDHFPVYIELKK
jgi:hypothetical protein